MAGQYDEDPMSAPSSQALARSEDSALPQIHIQILHVSDCPLLDGVRRTLDGCLLMTKLHVEVEELEGPHPSPTILINGVDPTGRRAPTGASCRLDAPTEEQIMAH
jgi:hypothetical protein